MGATGFAGSVAALAFAGVVAGCSFSVGGGTPLVANADLQKDVSQRLEQAGVKTESVTCTEDLVGEVGKTTRCDVVIDPTNSIQPVVTVTKVDGTEVSYELAPAVSKDQLEKKVASLISEASGTKVDSVACDAGLAGTKGDQTHCAVTAGGVTVRRTVEVTGVDGLLMNLNLVPVLTKDEVQKTLGEQVTEQLGQPPESVDCAGDLEGKPGTTMHCKVDTATGSLDMVLTVTSVDGDRVNYSFESQG